MIRTAAKVLFFSKTQVLFPKKWHFSQLLENCSKIIVFLGHFPDLIQKKNGFFHPKP